VLHFAPRVCWPLDTGAKLRNYHLARVLSARANVTLLAFEDTERPPVSLKNIYENVITVERSPGYTLLKIFRGAFGRTPLPLLNYTTIPMKKTLRRTLKDQQFDIVQVESIHLMGYLPIIRLAARRSLVVCDWHNIESELMRRYSEREPSLLRQLYALKTTRQLSDVEEEATRAFDAHVVVSERDGERLRELGSATAVSVIENGVDSAHYSDSEIDAAHAAWRNHNGGEVSGSAPQQNRIVFVGSMDYHANIDGVVAFAREVWPALHETHSEMIFTIVGRDPSAEVLQLGSMPGIEVTGTVDDVRPYYREAILSIVPLKVGGGSRLKILEAMAAGVPVVSTTLGAEGLDVQPGVNIFIADTNEQQRETITTVIENEGLRRQLRVEGRALVARRYDWSQVGDSLFKLYEGLLAARGAT
jgi:glycosyltransferase involved in cell wall biosynthesis